MVWLLSTGLDEQRANLYLASLQKSEATAKDLAAITGLGRTAVYDNLRVLKERGYVHEIFHGKRKVYVPLHPKELLKKMEGQKEQLKDLLPDFLAMYATGNKQPFVQLFEGSYAAREVYEDILKTTKKEYCYFSPPQLTLQVVDEQWITKWVERRVAKGIISKSLRVKTKEVTDKPFFYTEQKYLRQIRYLPAYVDFKASIYVYENNVGVISTKQEGSAFIIYSPDLAYSFRQIFDFLWSVSLKS